MDEEKEKISQWYDLDKVLLNPSPMSQQEFYPCEDLKQGLFQTPVLCIGAGGLGCEILKNLALSGIKDLHVIDLDTIDLTNLNRQFLFRQDDVGKSKASVSANYIMNRIPQTSVKYYQQKIQEFPLSFYQQFPIIVAGLDNVEARRWINQVVHRLVQKDKIGNILPETMHYLIDGGTEGLNGQARVIAPFRTACYECTINQLPKQTQYQMCTIANTPRIPEHCIAYVFEILWDKTFPEQKIDKDSYEHMNWIYEQALKRSLDYNIQGVTYKLTLGVVKNIIPAIASTNAIIAASCVTEVFKILTGNGQIMDNYYKWIGQAEYQGINTTIISQQREDNCSVCQVPVMEIKIKQTDKLNYIVDLIKKKFKIDQLNITNQNDQILVTSIIGLQSSHLFKMELTIQELIDLNLFVLGQILYCQGPYLLNGLEIKIVIE